MMVEFTKLNGRYFTIIHLGPYQPSHEVMLKFYGYYKQATQGKCNQPKPSFWDVVGKAKWEAWNKCGNISKNDAMSLYIEGLKQVMCNSIWYTIVSTFVVSYSTML